MDFTKIKHNKGTVTLEWTDEGATDTKRTTLTSGDEPEKDFSEAMQALAPIVCELIEVPTDYAEGLTVIGVSMSYNEHQGRGCVITCLKALGDFNAPLVLNTPHMPEDNEHGPSMPGKLIRALETLETCATRFKNGHRLQMDLIAA